MLLLRINQKLLIATRRAGADIVAVDNMESGYVYILTNPSYPPNLLKIGMTTRRASDRAREMFEGATGVPTRFKVVFEHPVSNCALAEQLVHSRLAHYRQIEYREFFEVELNEAIKVLRDACAEIERTHSQNVRPMPDTRRATITDKPHIHIEPSVTPRKSNPEETAKLWISGVFSVMFILAMVQACSSFFR